MEEFVDRNQELDFLRERYEREDSDLIVVYGRRRVGKSELVRQSLKDVENSIYFQATESTPEIQVQDFVEAGKENFPQLERLENDWEILLEHLGNQNAVVVIDEFPYLIEADNSVPSRFQRVWDTKLKDTDLTLVLIGSSISVMEEKVLSGGSPLHGRRTGSIDLQPLKLENLRGFDSVDQEDLIRTYCIFGGTPHYLGSLDGEKSLEENIEDLVLFSDGKLHDEPEFLLRSELDKPNRYFSVLKTVASGSTTQNEIAQATGIDSSQIGNYLSKLRKLRLIEREVPVTEDPKKTRRSIYRVADPFFKFWFRFVYGKEDRIELSKQEAYEKIVEPGLNDFIAEQYEKICQDILPDLIEADYYRIGRWWYKENEIDVVGLADDKIVLGECKYRNSKTGADILKKLENKKEKIRITNKSNKDFKYILFSENGFTDKLEELENEREDLHLYTSKEVLESQI